MLRVRCPNLFWMSLSKIFNGETSCYVDLSLNFLQTLTPFIFPSFDLESLYLKTIDIARDDDSSQEFRHVVDSFFR